MRGEIVTELENIVGTDWVVTKREAMQDYLVDKTVPIICPKPAEDVVLVKPGSAEEISDVMKFANRWKIPVFPRGGGTGLVGGAVPTENGIVLSLERLNQIEEIDEENLMVVAQAGVTFAEINKRAEPHGLFFPPHPGDEAAQVGGIISTNAGGVGTVKWGVIRDYVKGVEVVLPTGEILKLGGKLLKDVTGYSLLHLLIGSGGTLGIVTKGIFRLYPLHKASASLIVSYESPHDAIHTVPKILQQGLRPLAIEFFFREVIEKSAEHLGLEWPAKKGEADLYIIVTGTDEEEVYSMAERIDEICRENKAIDTLIAESRKEQEDLLNIRSQIYEPYVKFTIDFLDVGVPPGNIAKLIDKIDDIGKKYNCKIPLFGHAGDGNMHAAILTQEAGGPNKEKMEKMKREIYDAAHELGGVVTAEHGIGKVRIKELKRYTSEKEIETMSGIKKIFDPNNILNPGAMVPKS